MEADRQLHSGNMKHTSLTRQSADKELKIEVEHLCFASAHCGLDGEASEILFASHCPTATSLLVCIPCPARVRFPARVSKTWNIISISMHLPFLPFHIFTVIPIFCVHALALKVPHESVPFYAANTSFWHRFSF